MADERSTYKHRRDPAKRRAYMLDYMRRRRARSKQAANADQAERWPR